MLPQAYHDGIGGPTGITSLELLLFFVAMSGVVVFYLRVVRPRGFAASEKQYPA